MKNYLKVVLMALSIILLSACGSNSSSGGVSSNVGNVDESINPGGNEDDGSSSGGDSNVEEVVKSVSISLVKEEDGTYTFNSVVNPVDSNVKYSWEFGGRINQPAQRSVANPVISYIDEGNYTVQLTADIDGEVLKSEVIDVSYFQPVKTLTNYNREPYLWARFFAGAVTDKKLYIWGDEIVEATHHNIDNELIKEFVLTKHSYIVLTESGKVYTYGVNKSATLGDGTKDDRFEFKVVETLSNVKIEKIYAGINSVYAIDSEGKVWSWGNSLLGIGSKPNNFVPIQIDELNNIVELAVGLTSVYALNKDGQVWSWGDNTYGQLGIDNTTEMNSPVKIEALADKVITSINAGKYTVFAIDKDGKLYGWGSNEYNILGLNTVNNKVPNLIKGLEDKFIVSVVQNDHGSVLVIDGDGKVYSWGQNEYCILGHGNTDNLTEPKIIDYFNNNNIAVRNIVTKAQSYSAFAIDANGKLYSWGKNSFGYLGLNGNLDSEQCQSVPAYVESLSGNKIVYVEDADGNAYAVSNTGKIFAVGKSSNNRLGISNIDRTAVFIEMTNIPALK